MWNKLMLRWLPAVLGCLVLSSAAVAEDLVEFSPFIDPSAFDIDFQLFAPADVSTYGGGPEPNTGFYFTWARLYWNVSRPELETQNYDFNKGWGNRFDLGYMTEEDRGWMLNYIRLDGPHAITVTEDEFGILTATANDMTFNSVSLNRVWRAGVHNCGGGAYVEPFVGIRWMQVNDFFPKEFIVFLDEFIPLDVVRAENNIFGGQVGFRWFRQKGRWVLSSEARFFGGYNWQFFDESSVTHEEAMFVGDMRLDAAFIVTREVALHVGVQALHFPFGIGRADSSSLLTSEDLTMAGVVFGLEFNR